MVQFGAVTCRVLFLMAFHIPHIDSCSDAKERHSWNPLSCWIVQMAYEPNVSVGSVCLLFVCSRVSSCTTTSLGPSGLATSTLLEAGNARAKGLTSDVPGLRLFLAWGTDCLPLGPSGRGERIEATTRMHWEIWAFSGSQV